MQKHDTELAKKEIKDEIEQQIKGIVDQEIEV